ncbi:hypothetical protein NC652_019707 [Populus alba x Populus x berolinensis]|nr:hypothetical protein NC652_019707 [Populus alba x Populus x berolinensis]
MDSLINFFGELAQTIKNTLARIFVPETSSLSCQYPESNPNMSSLLFCDHPLHTQVWIIAKEEKDKKIQDLSGELQHERERSASFQQQLCMILKDLKEHEEFLSLRVEDIIKTLKEIELVANIARHFWGLPLKICDSDNI